MWRGRATIWLTVGEAAPLQKPKDRAVDKPTLMQADQSKAYANKNHGAVSATNRVENSTQSGSDRKRSS